MLVKTYSILNDTGDGVLYINRLQTEIEATSHVTDFENVISSGDDIFVHGGTLANEAGLDSIVLNHIDSTLEEYKLAKCIEIDTNTVTLIGSGFVYDGGTFSLSSRAQFNWEVLKQNKPDFTFPKKVSKKDNTDYDLTEANVNAFWSAGKVIVDGYLDSGRALKVLVMAAIDKVGVDAVVDNR